MRELIQKPGWGIKTVPKPRSASAVHRDFGLFPVTDRTNHPSEKRHRSRKLTGSGDARAAFTVIELIATLILLGVVFTLSISVLAVVARQRHSAEQRQFALQHAANVLERAAAANWADVTSGAQPTPQVSTDLNRILPGLEQQLEASDPEEFGGKRLSLSLRWKDRQGLYVSPIKLTTWIYPLQGASS